MGREWLQIDQHHLPRPSEAALFKRSSLATLCPFVLLLQRAAFSCVLVLDALTVEPSPYF